MIAALLARQTDLFQFQLPEPPSPEHQVWLALRTALPAEVPLAPISTMVEVGRPSTDWQCQLTTVRAGRTTHVFVGLTPLADTHATLIHRRISREYGFRNVFSGIRHLGPDDPYSPRRAAARGSEGIRDGSTAALMLSRMTEVWLISGCSPSYTADFQTAWQRALLRPSRQYGCRLSQPLMNRRRQSYQILTTPKSGSEGTLRLFSSALPLLF